MSKFIGVLAGVALFAFAGVASAATISDARFSNNQTEIDATGGATVNGTFTLTVGPGEVVEWFRLLPAGNPFTEVSVGGQMGYQEGVHTKVPFSVKVPPNTGTYNVDAQGAGIYGGNRAISGSDTVVVGPTSIGTVRVVASSNSSGDLGAADEDFWDKLTAWLEKYLAAKEPAKPAYCASIVTGAGFYMGSSGASVTAVQQALISAGFSIPAIQYSGAAYGYWGAQSMAAYAQAVAKCN